MIREAHTQQFLLSEVEARCSRPRARAYAMLRLCQMYQQVPGPEVPVSDVRLTAAVVRPAHSNSVATRTAATEKAKRLPCSTSSRKATSTIVHFLS